MLGKLIRNAIGAGQPAVRRAAADAEFLSEFDLRYAPMLRHRASGFRVMFDRLQQRCREQGKPALIVETGSMRVLDNWAGDGQSTRLWKAFSEHFPSEIHTVDLDPEAALVVNDHCGAPVQAHTGDSVAYLYGLASVPKPRQIDMLYLDSYDYDPNDPFPSAFHHVKELIAVRPCLGKGSIIAIDDNLLLPDGGFTGKGYLAMQWFDHLGIECIHRGYQFVWQL